MVRMQAAPAIIVPILTQSIACARANVGNCTPGKNKISARATPAAVSANKIHSARWRSTATAADKNATPTMERYWPSATTLGATTTNINFALDPGGRISGNVKDANNSPLANVEVRTYDSNDDRVDTVLTDASGNFITSGLATGTYYVATRNSSGLADYIWNGLLCAGDSCNETFGTPISVTVPTTTGGINFVLPTGQTISGTVTAGSGPGGLPLANVSIGRASWCPFGGIFGDLNGVLRRMPNRTARIIKFPAGRRSMAG